MTEAALKFVKRIETGSVHCQTHEENLCRIEVRRRFFK